MIKVRIEFEEYSSATKVFYDGEEFANPTICYEDNSQVITLKLTENKEYKFKLKEPLFKIVPDKLGLHLEEETQQCQKQQTLKAHWFVGVTRIPIEDGEIIVQVKPKIENIDFAEMLVRVLSHPKVAPHIKKGETYEILWNDEPIEIEIEEVPEDYLIFLLIHYIKILDDIVRRGLQKGYQTTEENLRSRIRGRLLIGETVRMNWPRSRKHYAYCSYQTYSEDTLENRILKAAYIKARAYLESLNIVKDNLAEWIGNIGMNMERVSTVRIYPTDFALATIQRIRPDYREALNLAKIILRSLGYDPTVETTKEQIRHIYPYWIDMNELFERYVEVKLRNGEIEVEKLKGFEVYPGYGLGEGIKIEEKIKIEKWKDCEKTEKEKDVRELRPDFVLVKDGKIIIGDAKYKEDYQSENVWIKEDLQQIALYGRIKWGKIKEWIRNKHGVEVDIKGDEQEPDLYIFYPSKSGENKTEANTFRNIHKIGIKLPLKQKSR